MLGVGAFFMSLGFLIRFTRRNGISAWAFIFETLVSDSSRSRAVFDSVIIVSPSLALRIPRGDLHLTPPLI